MNAREIALMNGEVTYTHHKMCKHLHEPIRYSSTGQCVACVKGKVDHYRNIAKNARSRENNMRAEGMIQVPIFRWRDQETIVNRIQSILIERGQRFQELAGFLTLIGSSIMTKADLLEHFKLDMGGYVTNFNDFAHRSGDSGQTETEIRGEWYPDVDLQRLIKGEIKYVERVEPPKPTKTVTQPKAVLPEPPAPRAPLLPQAPDDEGYPSGLITDADRAAIAALKAEFGDD